MKAPAVKSKPPTSETASFQVRGGFVLHLNNKAHRAGEIVDLTEKQAHAHKHMIELAPDQEDSGKESAKK
ncbi:MAG TPA: hypothetical protein PLT25_05820 [Acidocella sp.]|nr:hypothetical protein [Acidocella sp.]